MSILEELWYGNIKPCEDKEISDEEKKCDCLLYSTMHVTDDMQQSAANTIGSLLDESTKNSKVVKFPA